MNILRSPVKKEDSSLILFIVLALALSLLIHTFFSVVHTSQDYTGKATTQTATVSLTVQSNGTQQGANVTSNETGDGSGGRRGLKADVFFSVEPLVFSVELMEGAEQGKSLRIKNTGDLTLTFMLSANRDFVTFSRSSFTLRPGEATSTIVTMAAERAGITTAVITVETSLASKHIPVLLDVQSPGALYGLALTLPSQFKIVKPGADLFSTLVITKLDGGFVDVQFVLMDATNTIVYKEQENIDVDNTLTIDKTFHIPASLLPGTYAYGAIVHYRGETKTKTQLITVKNTAPQKQPTFEQPQQQPRMTLFILIALLSFIGLQYLLLKRKKLHL